MCHRINTETTEGVDSTEIFGLSEDVIPGTTSKQPARKVLL